MPGEEVIKPEPTVITPTEENRFERLAENCVNKYKYFIHTTGLTYCKAVFDGYLCWPPTPEGELTTQKCPPVRLSDTRRQAYRECGPDGNWVGATNNISKPQGWTNYTVCFPQEVQRFVADIYEKNTEDAKQKFIIAQNTRYLEIAGFSISVIALVLSLHIFNYYRALANTRTRIHKNLFSAMLIQVLIRLTVYIDQALVRKELEEKYTYENITTRGIDNIPYLCEASYIMMEYAITAMFVWMLIEGAYLHSVITNSTMRARIRYDTCFVIGWGIPFVITVVWAVVNGTVDKDNILACWFGYNFSNIYWIVELPRLAAVTVNALLLLRILIVLVNKLHSSQTSETRKIGKTVRATLLLLPLLGLTNGLNMIRAPLHGSVGHFAVWSYTTHFLRSFQGCFIAIIYCFLNGEVRTVLKKHYMNLKAIRGLARRPTASSTRPTVTGHPVTRRDINIEMTESQGVSIEPTLYPDNVLVVAYAHEFYANNNLDIEAPVESNSEHPGVLYADESDSSEEDAVIRREIKINVDFVIEHELPTNN